MFGRLLSLFFGKTKHYPAVKKAGYPRAVRKLIEQKLEKLESLIGYSISEPEHYIKAITHKSFSEFNSIHLENNERLEFLGDSVLGMVIAEYLFNRYEEKDEGFLTKTRSHLVSRAALGHYASKISLIDYLMVNENYTTVTPKGIVSIMSNAIEALIGAIYMDKGMEEVKQFINKYIILPGVSEGAIFADYNYKSQLLEYSQSQKMELPGYFLIKEEGPQHNKVFTVEVAIGAQKLGYGNGRNKKEAEQKAACAALITLGVIPVAATPAAEPVAVQ